MSRGKVENRGWVVRFAEIENNAHRNAALSTEQTESFSEENDGNFADREVLISRKVPGQADWRLKPRRVNSDNDD